MKMALSKMFFCKLGESFLKKSSLCLKNISKDFTAKNMQKTGVNGCVYDLAVCYETIAISDIVNNHKHLMKKLHIL